MLQWRPAAQMTPAKPADFMECLKGLTFFIVFKCFIHRVLSLLAKYDIIYI